MTHCVLAGDQSNLLLPREHAIKFRNIVVWVKYSASSSLVELHVLLCAYDDKLISMRLRPWDGHSYG